MSWQIGGSYEGGGITQLPDHQSGAFNGSNSILNNGSELTGAADSTLWTGSLWFYQNSLALEMLLSQSPTAASALTTRIVGDANGQITVDGLQAPDTGVLTLSIASYPGAYAAGRWNHLMWSVDLTNTAKRHIYINEVPSLIVTTYNNNSIDFTRGDFYVGNRGDNPSFFDWNGYLADIYYYPGTYVDLSVEANRRLFVTAGHKPTNPSIPIAALGTPIIALYGPWADGWATNKGSGGGFSNSGVTQGIGVTGF